MTNRQRISEKLLADLASVWETHGKSVLARLAVTEPGKLAASRLRPVAARGVVHHGGFQRIPGNLEPDEWATLRRVLDIIQQCAPAGSDPSKVFETIEFALRADYAKEIAGN